jgi:hypothetical protein
LISLGNSFNDKKAQKKISEEFQHFLKCERRNNGKAHEFQFQKINRIKLLEIISRWRKNLDQELRKRDDLDKNKGEKAKKEILRPPKSQRQKFVGLGLFLHENISGHHDKHNKLDHKDRPFIDRSRRKRSKDEEPQKSIVDDIGVNPIS